MFAAFLNVDDVCFVYSMYTLQLVVVKGIRVNVTLHGILILNDSLYAFL